MPSTRRRGTHFVFWEFVGGRGRALLRMVLGALVSLARQHTEVNKSREEPERSWEPSITSSVQARTVTSIVRFDTEVAHPCSEQTFETMAASRLLGSPLPDFTLQPEMSLAVP
jgi:hypothetical protein